MRLRLLASALLATLSISATAVAQTEAITGRREGLRGVGAHMEAMKAVVDSRGDVRQTAPRIEAMITFFSGFPARFPAGTDGPRGTDPGQTRALPAIWSDNAGFVTANNNTLTQLMSLRAMAAAGDAAGFATAYGQLGGTCGACHRAYRAR